MCIGVGVRVGVGVGVHLHLSGSAKHLHLDLVCAQDKLKRFLLHMLLHFLLQHILMTPSAVSCQACWPYSAVCRYSSLLLQARSTVTIKPPLMYVASHLPRVTLPGCCKYPTHALHAWLA